MPAFSPRPRLVTRTYGRLFAHKASLQPAWCGSQQEEGFAPARRPAPARLQSGRWNRQGEQGSRTPGKIKSRLASLASPTSMPGAAPEAFRQRQCPRPGPATTRCLRAALHLGGFRSRLIRRPSWPRRVVLVCGYRLTSDTGTCVGFVSVAGGDVEGQDPAPRRYAAMVSRPVNDRPGPSPPFLRTPSGAIIVRRSDGLSP
jgi:hypothetical protein